MDVLTVFKRVLLGEDFYSGVTSRMGPKFENLDRNGSADEMAEYVDCLLDWDQWKKWQQRY